MSYSYSKTQRSDGGEARTRGPSVSSQAHTVSYCAPVYYMYMYMVFIISYMFVLVVGVDFSIPSSHK